jgi:hypothetical protein
MAQDQKAGLPATRYVNRPEVSEIFFDHLESTFFGDGLVRLTLSTTRWPQAKPNEPMVGERATAARLVLPAKTAVDLVNALNQLMGALLKEGVVKQQQPAPVKENVPN